MCGIAGYIGKPIDHKVTFDLMNALMVKTESRGEHASGFWACVNNENKVYYYKDPIKASEFVKKRIWRETEERKIDLMLGHCRYATFGSGDWKINKNNHPHVSDDCRIALIHNGKISEYDSLKNEYPINTNCDSEIILRIFESGEYLHDKKEFLESQLQKAKDSISDLHRMYGLKKIFSKIHYSAMAVAIGEYLDNNERALWLFHDEYRPLCLIDLRETMGQFFFCSTEEIFRAAVDYAKISTSIIPIDQKIMILPTNWVYHFKMNNNGDIDWEKIKVNKTRKYGSWDSDEKEVKEPEGSEKLTRNSIEIITKPYSDALINIGEIVNHYTKNKDKIIADDASEIEFWCDKGSKLLEMLLVKVSNNVAEGNMWQEEIEELAIVLEEIVTQISNLSDKIK